MTGLAVLGAEAVGTLHPLRLAVYNLGGVVPDVKCTVTLKDVTALVTRHATNLRQNATQCNGTDVPRLWSW